MSKGQKFVAKLNRNTVYTDAIGMAGITVMGDDVRYSVIAADIDDVTAGHIHINKQGENENDPVVVTLFRHDSPTTDVIESGTITADKLEGPMASKQLTEFIAAMSNKELYVRITTTNVQSIAISGRILCSSLWP